MFSDDRLPETNDCGEFRSPSDDQDEGEPILLEEFPPQRRSRGTARGGGTTCGDARGGCGGNETAADFGGVADLGYLNLDPVNDFVASDFADDHIGLITEPEVALLNSRPSVRNIGKLVAGGGLLDLESLGQDCQILGGDLGDAERLSSRFPHAAVDAPFANTRRKDRENNQKNNDSHQSIDSEVFSGDPFDTARPRHASCDPSEAMEKEVICVGQDDDCKRQLLRGLSGATDISVKDGETQSENGTSLKLVELGQEGPREIKKKKSDPNFFCQRIRHQSLIDVEFPSGAIAPSSIEEEQRLWESVGFSATLQSSVNPNFVALVSEQSYNESDHNTEEREAQSLGNRSNQSSSSYQYSTIDAVTDSHLNPQVDSQQRSLDADSDNFSSNRKRSSPDTLGDILKDREADGSDGDSSDNNPPSISHSSGGNTELRDCTPGQWKSNMPASLVGTADCNSDDEPTSRESSSQSNWEKGEILPGLSVPASSAQPVDRLEGNGGRASLSASPPPLQLGSQSFPADSPYLSSHIDKEMHNLAVLSDTVREISARTTTFGKCGFLMAEATRRLSQACKLQPSSSSSKKDKDSRGVDLINEEKVKERKIIAEKRESVGEKMGDVLGILGEVRETLSFVGGGGVLRRRKRVGGFFYRHRFASLPFKRHKCSMNPWNTISTLMNCQLLFYT